MKVNVMLRGNRDSVFGGGGEVPIAQSCQNLLFDSMSESLLDASTNIVALSVDGDFDDDIAFEVSGQIRDRNYGVWSNDGQSGPNVVASGGTIGK